MRGPFFLLICFISASFSEKLSDAEDEERSKSCGRVSNPQSTSNDDLSPWTVRLDLNDIYYPATIVSKRHVITSANVALKKDGNWKWSTDETSVDVSTCKNEFMEVHAVNKIAVDLRACSNHFLCPNEPKISFKSAFYLGSCDPSQFDTGVIVAEMVDNIPEDPEYLTPACLTESDDVISEGESLYVQEAAADSNRSPIINIIQAKSTACRGTSNQTICATTDECLNGRGSGLMKRKDGRETLVGASAYYDNFDCHSRVFGSVVYSRKNICDLTGICKTTSTEQPKPKPPRTPLSMVNPFRKLSSAENTQHLNTCGKPTNPGSKLPNDLSPWTVTVLVEEKSGRYFQPATLISKRHVVVLAFSLIYDKYDNTQTRVWQPDSAVVDVSKCKNNQMEIPKKYMEKTTVELSSCKDTSKCGSNIVHSVRAAVYLGVCNTLDLAFGVILLEMDKDLPDNLPYLVPACLAEKRIPQLDEQWELHSIGLDGKSTLTKSISDVQTVNCEYNTHGHYSKVCSNNPSCTQDSSGGFLKSVDGKQTLFGILYYRDPDCKTLNHIVSMEVLSDEICLFAGICGKQTVASSTNNKKTQRPGSNSGQRGSETSDEIEGETTDSSSSLSVYSGFVILLALIFMRV